VSLMPCFQSDQAFAEGIIIAKILAGYGELEVMMADCLIAIEGQLDTPIRALFCERGEKKRIENAKDALLSDYTKAGLGADLVEALDDMDWCRTIRNQYAHYQWYWTKQEGLCFVNLEELAQQSTAILKLTEGKHSVDAQVLLVQEEYLYYVKESFVHLASAYRAWDRARSSSTQRISVYPKPSKLARPPLHKD